MSVVEASEEMSGPGADGPDRVADLPDSIANASNEGEVDEAEVLRALEAHVEDQDDLERTINRQADELLAEQAIERETKRLEKAEADKRRLQTQIRRINERASNERLGPATARRLATEASRYEAEIERLDTDIKDIAARIEERRQALGTTERQVEGNHRLPTETRREFLIRTGKITPFSKAAGESSLNVDENLQSALLQAEKGIETEETEEEIDEEHLSEFRSHRNLKRPGFVDVEDEGVSAQQTSSRPSKRRRSDKEDIDDSDAEGFAGDQKLADHLFPDGGDSSDYASSRNPDDDRDDSNHSSAFGSDSEETTFVPKTTQKDKEDLRGIDDGNEKLYQKRLQDWSRRRKAARDHNRPDTVDVNGEDAETEEWHLPHPTEEDHVFEGGFSIPGDVYPALFDYQKTGIQWLWELYSQHVGGIVGDEMGLGKTIQVIAFLAGLHHSKKLNQPVIIVAPATVMKQWVNEFHTWWPPLRVSILHSSGSGMIDVGRESRREEEMLERRPGAAAFPASRNSKTARKIVNRVIEEGHVLVTTYSGLQSYADLLIPVHWEYAVLDEGHKIRNPNTSITLHCKELRTPNRIILSGTPMQNNLMELWSLFDFIFPMRLGNLVEFRNQFEIPIRIGGYANASNLQVQTAGKCAEVLKDAISPYLLQRNKVDVAADLPKKTERVLFCKLTKPQREAYEAFLSGDDMKSILNGRRQVLYGVDILRKICNHPDLVDHRTLSIKRGYNYGSGVKSGKMVVVKELLEVWKRAGHKTLLFSQSRIMLDILEKYVQSMDGISSRRMDGTTPIAVRQALVDDFNRNPDAHVFLLTTKVGGLGVNLTGADRVIIFDPDWNPSTDIQARERAWRLGQKREVEIYRLMVAGTIEEKIFHRQIFKQFLTNKILKDPKQRQTFQMQDLHDLFSLGNANDGETETGKLFKGTETRFDDASNPSADGSSVPSDKGRGLSRPKPAEESPFPSLAGISSIRPFTAPDDPQEDPEKEEEDSTSATDSPHKTPLASESNPDARNSESRIMSALFARSGVTSAVEHDRIVNGKRIVSADPHLIRREAEKAAREAAAELRRAETEARNLPAGTVTWTGEFGSAGRPSAGGPNTPGRGSPSVSSLSRSGSPAPQPNLLAAAANRRRGAGPSSAGVLAGLAARQHANEDESSSSATKSEGKRTAKDKKSADFMRQIRDFINAHGGRVYTQMLINHFNWQCTTAKRTAEFQAMLRQIATLENGSGGRGSWVLREEYKKN